MLTVDLCPLQKMKDLCMITYFIIIIIIILLDFITRTILVEEYRSLSSSLCNFLHSPVTPSLLGPNILLNTLFSNTLSLCSSLNVSEKKFQIHTKQRAKL